MKEKVIFVYGAAATGKTTFIKNNFSKIENMVYVHFCDYILLVNRNFKLDSERPIVNMKKIFDQAKLNLVADIIDLLNHGKSVVVEDNMSKSTARIKIVNHIRSAFKDITIEAYVMRPSYSVWEKYLKETEYPFTVDRLKTNDLPSFIEGFDKVYEVLDNDINLRLDEPNRKSVDEIYQKSEEIQNDQKNEEIIIKQRVTLLESMYTRPFYHYCEVCGTKIYCTAKEADNDGWNYPPKKGRFGVFGPRTCGKCDLNESLYHKLIRQNINVHKNLAFELNGKDLETWLRIKEEPESLLEDE